MKQIIISIFISFTVQYLSAQQLYVVSHDTLAVVKVGKLDKVEIETFQNENFSGRQAIRNDSLLINEIPINLKDVSTIEVNSFNAKCMGFGCVGASFGALFLAGMMTLIMASTYEDMGNAYNMLLGYPASILGYFVSKGLIKNKRKFSLEEGKWHLAISDRN